MAKRPIRVGIVGVGRGQAFARATEPAGMQVVAFCDTWLERLEEVAKHYGAATYTDFETFLAHDMDAVVLANYFHQHAPLAIRALQAGKHVMSETSACKTLAEAVALVRTVERAGKIYMFAENYPYMAVNQEMRRLYQAGEIGEVRYAEGEYNHPFDEVSRLRISPGLNHWRNHIPPTYYCTHALAPLMYITDTMPVAVNALAITDPEQERKSVRVGDPGFALLCRMDNGAVFRLFGLMLPGHSVYYRLHGTRGMVESMRGAYTGMVRILHEEWDCRPGESTERIYRAEFPAFKEESRRAGHGGGDFWTVHAFAEAIRAGQQPYLDVYRGVTMSVVGIQAWRSALADGAPVRIPDFRDESDRCQYEGDDWSPFPEDRRPGQPWPSLRGRLEPSPEALALARQVWDDLGYRGE